jgi:methionyl-tRNA formyltransferase
LKPTEQHQILAELNADLLVVVAYGLILPGPFLQAPRLGCINVHASLLPRWRGAAPIERAILAGDKETGITIMQMDEGLDTGDMIHKVTVPIGEHDDRLLLQEKLADAGVQGLIHVLDNFSELAPAATRQDDSMSNYARKVEKIEALINWDEGADFIDRQVRAGLGRSPAYSFLGEGRVQILKATAEISSHSLAPGTIVNASKDVLSVACRDSVLQIKALQFAGKKPMEIAVAINSRSALLKPGNHFTSDAPIQS